MKTKFLAIILAAAAVLFCFASCDDGGGGDDGLDKDQFVGAWKTDNSGGVWRQFQFIDSSNFTLTDSWGGTHTGTYTFTDPDPTTFRGTITFTLEFSSADWHLRTWTSSYYFYEDYLALMKIDETDPTGGGLYYKQ